jgi:hypothetical protein
MAQGPKPMAEASIPGEYRVGKGVDPSVGPIMAFLLVNAGHGLPLIRP